MCFRRCLRTIFNWIWKTFWANSWQFILVSVFGQYTRYPLVEIRYTYKIRFKEIHPWLRLALNLSHITNLTTSHNSAKKNITKRPSLNFVNFYFNILRPFSLNNFHNSKWTTTGSIVLNFVELKAGVRYRAKRQCYTQYTYRTTLIWTIVVYSICLYNSSLFV